MRALARPAVGAAVLLAVLAACSVAALAAGGGRPLWTEAVGFAAAVALAGSQAAWLLGRLPIRDPAAAVSGGLGGVAVRIRPPLAALVWLRERAPALAAAGADRLLLVFYLALLATDVLLNIIGRPSAVSSGPHGTAR